MSESDDVITHLSQLNFSIFTKKLEEMSGKNRPKDEHGKQRKKWLRVIRNMVRTQSIQTVITFLYAAKAHTASSQHILKLSLQRWKEGLLRRREIRLKWQHINDLVISVIHQNRLSEYREKVHNQRAYLTSRYLASLPEISNPNYLLFFRQINDNQIDEKPPEKEPEINSDEQSSEHIMNSHEESENSFHRLESPKHKIEERDISLVKEDDKDEDKSIGNESEKCSVDEENSIKDENAFNEINSDVLNDTYKSNNEFNENNELDINNEANEESPENQIVDENEIINENDGNEANNENNNIEANNENNDAGLHNENNDNEAKNVSNENESNNDHNEVVNNDNNENEINTAQNENKAINESNENEAIIYHKEIKLINEDNENNDHKENKRNNENNEKKSNPIESIDQNSKNETNDIVKENQENKENNVIKGIKNLRSPKRISSPKNEIDEIKEREVNPDLDQQRNTNPQQKSNIHFSFDQKKIKELIPQSVKDTFSRYDLSTFFVAFLIMISTIFLTYIFKSFIFWANGTFARYKEFEFNMTLPVYDPNYDVNVFLNYSEILPPESEINVVELLRAMSKELKDVKERQTELIDEVLQMRINN
ncbi:hypothetical protein M9Y10_041565 [Tritrichomonas musculus]|uniref:Uncharacterized protein n=1 Tax=Tritrichomonas musculus TaxID=1915356 RepID=A0ABR2K4T2_9EUKA